MKIALWIKIGVGFLALALAAVGLFLPIWPTTPFVLVAVGCFSSAPKLRSWILGMPAFREYYESYTAGKGISRRTLIASLMFLWAALIVSMVLMGKGWSTLLLLAVGAAVTVHILWISRSRTERGRFARKGRTLQQKEEGVRR